MKKGIILTALGALAGLGLFASSEVVSAATYTAVGPICDSGAKVGSTTYYSCNGSSHTALDMSNGTCGSWNHRGMLKASKAYKYYGGCSNTCSNPSSNPDCNGGAGNYIVVTGASGWEFRQLHINSNGDSKSKTCDRCAFGLVGATGNTYGAHVHADNRQYGTRKSSWYTSVGTTCGSSAYCEKTVGKPTL